MDEGMGVFIPLPFRQSCPALSIGLCDNTHLSIRVHQFGLVLVLVSPGRPLLVMAPKCSVDGCWRAVTISHENEMV